MVLVVVVVVIAVVVVLVLRRCLLTLPACCGLAQLAAARRNHTVGVWAVLAAVFAVTVGCFGSPSVMRFCGENQAVCGAVGVLAALMVVLWTRRAAEAMVRKMPATVFFTI